MSTIKELIHTHKVAIALAFLTGVIVALPQMYFRFNHPEFYEDGVETIELFSHSPWHARVREVQDGYPGLGSIYFKDGKDNPYIFQPLGTIITGYTGQVFGLGINDTFLLSKFIYSILTFLLIYTIVFSIGRNILAALTSTSVILLAGLILTPSGMRDFLAGSFLSGETSLHYLDLSAPVQSSMIYIFLFGFLVAFWQYYQRGGWQWGILSAVLLGLNTYNYFYSATYLVAFVGLLVLVFLLQRNWHEALRLLYVFLGGLAVSIPYFWNLYSASQYPAYEDIAKRVALISTHAPQFIGIVAFIGLVIFLLGFPREDKQKYIFSLSLLLTPFVTLNQQILTGKIMQAGHYHWYMHKPIAVLFATLTFFYLLERWKFSNRLITLVATVIIIAGFGIGFKTQILAYSYQQDGGYGERTLIESQKYAPVMGWLNLHAEKDAVVFGNAATSWITGIYTSLNVYYTAIAHLTLPATDARMRELLFTYYRLRDVNRENVKGVFLQERPFITTQLFGLYYRNDETGFEGLMPDEILDSLVRDYQTTLNLSTSEWLYKTWSKYEVEYVVWDRGADPEWQLDQYLFLTKEATFGDFTIYSFPGIKLK